MVSAAPHSAASHSAAPRSPAQRLNLACPPAPLDRTRLRRELERAPDGALLADMIARDRPHMFSDAAVFVDNEDIERMAAIVAAIERVIALPAYRAHVLAHAPETARHATPARGVFFGYDFHLDAGSDQRAAGPRLIEINTNAGGGLLNALLARASGAGHDDAPEHRFMDMFRAEWQTERGDRPLRAIAIVDVAPETQYLYPEFLLFRHLFERHGIAATICAPEALEWRDGALWHAEQRIDLVYNRLTDFLLTEASNDVLRRAWLAGDVVVTPHPHAYALYADKRNLTLLSDDALLARWGVDTPTRALLADGIPKTECVDPSKADDLWARRRELFFKPATGYGAKAAYRGKNLTHRVFGEILAGNYVAQALVPPASRRIAPAGDTPIGNDAPVDLKFDLRNYVYDGKVQLIAARLWEGQTTNFRTPGGGFAPVLAVPRD